MSPEANKPETQAGSPDFVQGIHPTDRVRPFKQGDLSGVHESLTAPEDTSRINRDTLDVEFNKVPLPPETKEKSGKKNLLLTVGGGVLGAVVTAGTILGFSGGEDPRPEQPVATASADPSPEAKAPANKADKEKQPKPAEKKVAGETMLAGIDGVPTQEQYDYAATTPILVEGGKPTAESAKKAVVALGEYFNVYMNSFKLEEDDPTGENTIKAGHILDNIYGPAGVRNPHLNFDFEKADGERYSRGSAFYVYKEEGLVSNMRTEPISEPVMVRELENGQPLWQVNAHEINTGNWDELTETPQRNGDYETTLYLSTYETADGLAWYQYDGVSEKLPNDLQ